MFNSKIDKSGNHVLLSIKGELVLNHANELKTALMDALSKSKKIFIEFSDIKAVDFSCLQLLCSAQKSAELQNKFITIRSQIPGILNKALLDMGFNRHIEYILGKKMGERSNNG
jgi:anti-anti-sigma regulatory factor